MEVVDVKNPLVSVYTCVYNGERTIHRVFESVKNLDYPNFEHVIINDGSTDKTDELIREYISQVPYVVKYYKKENGGKHTALNVAWGLAEGKFMINLDADDRLFPHAVTFLVDTYYSIPEDIRQEYWCVHGRCVTQNGEFVGDRYPDNINEMNWIEAGKRASKCHGDKIGLQVREYLNRYRFPEVVGVSHIAESIVWNQINKVYGTWYTNEVVRVYYVNEGGALSGKKTKRRQFGPLAYRLKWQIMHEEEYGKSLKSIVCYPLCYYIADKNFQMNNGYLDGIDNYKILLTILRPIMYVGAYIYRRIKKIKS